jgi:AcrR family transcriptional regulator
VRLEQVLMIEAATEKRKAGRKRNEDTRMVILHTALSMLEKLGFAALTVEGVAASAGVGKATIYRWWPNKAALVMEAYLTLRREHFEFRDTGDFRADLREQMHRVVEAFRGQDGRTMASILGSAQSDPELAQSFREGWLDKRRAESYAFLEAAVERGQLSRAVNRTQLLDALYGPLYYRLLIGHQPVTTELADFVAENLLGSLERLLTNRATVA